jgi:hypothetical protein
VGVRPVNKFVGGPYDGLESEDPMDLTVWMSTRENEKAKYRLIDIRPDGTRIYAYEAQDTPEDVA